MGNSLSQRLNQIYQDLGEVRILEIVEKLYKVMAEDTMIGFFFTGRDLKLISRKQTDFLLRAMGATQSYSGKAPSTAHADLPPIRLGQFNRRIQLLMFVLNSQGVSPEHTKTWVEFERSFEKAIVG